MKRFLLAFACLALAANLNARVIPVTFDTATSTFYTNGVVWVPGTGSGGSSGTNTWLIAMAPLALNTAQTNTYTNGVIVEATVGLQTLLSTDVAKVVAMVETNSGSGAFVIKDIAMFGGIAASNQNTLVYTVPPACRHYLTNLSAGTSIATVITNWIDQLITAGPTGATGPALGNTNGIGAGFNVPALTNFGASQLVGSIDAQGSALFESTFSAPFGLSTLFRTTNTSWLTIGGIQTNLGALYLKQTFGAGLTNLAVDANGQVIGVAVGVGGTAGTNDLQLTGTTVIRGRLTNEIQSLLTGNVLNGTNQYNSLITTTATTLGAVSNLVEMDYTIWLTNSIATVVSGWTNVTDYVGYKGVQANSITRLGVTKRGSRTFMYLNNNPGRWSLLPETDLTNVVVDGTVAQFHEVVATNNVNVLLTNVVEALTLTVRQNAIGFWNVTFINNGIVVRTNASLAVGTNGYTVYTFVPGTNSTTVSAIGQTGFQ